MRAMVLAAGRGERMRPLTDELPKPLLCVGGQPLIAWHLQALARAGVREVVINLSWQGERLRAALGSGTGFGVSLAYSDEGPVAYETGGGILQALPLLGDEPFLIVNGDVWTDVDYAALRIPPRSLAHLVLVPNPPQHACGDFTLEAGALHEGQGERYTYSGVGIYRPELFRGREAGRFPLLPVLRDAIAARRLSGELYRGDWQDVGTPERLHALDARVSRERAAGSR